MRRTKKKKARKIVRYARVSKRNLRRLKRKKVIGWLEKNLKGHPFILGILFFAWFSYLIELILRVPDTAESLKAVLKLDGIIFGLWFILVVLSNALRDAQRVKWYFRKRFVFVLLSFFYPLGLVFLWTGSKFKDKTKIVFTIIFGLFFLTGIVYQEKNKRAFFDRSPFERIIQMMSKPKKKIFLSKYSGAPLGNMTLTRMQDKDRMRLAVSEIYARYSQSIVSIKTKNKFGRQIGLGSGFIISKDGFIVTNYHVLASAYQAEVNIGDKAVTDVRLVKAIPEIDIAVLKVETEGISPLVIGDSNELVSGQFVVSLGSPLGLEHSVSSGIVSAIRSAKDMKLIQTTAPVSMGSSGGPLLNEYGEVVGITTMASFFLAQNVNFAIPINYLESIINTSSDNF